MQRNAILTSSPTSEISFNSSSMESFTFQNVEPLPTYEDKSGDYQGSYDGEDFSVGVCEIQGKRPGQEDSMAFAIEEAFLFNQLSREAQELALLQTFKALQAEKGQVEKQGSTACMATAWITVDKKLHVTTANLGDSAAYLVVLDKENNTQISKRLNKLHKPSHLKEKERIEKTLGEVIDGRLLGTFNAAGEVVALSLSRAFGDIQFDDYGISHTPEINFTQVKLLKNQKAFILVACDGFDEEIEAVEIGNFLARNIKLSSEIIANRLVSEAFENGSKDNISVMLMSVSEIPVSGAIFDGHGGDKVSKEISAAYYATLKTKLENVAKLSQQEVLTDLAEVKNESEFLNPVKPIKNKLSVFKIPGLALLTPSSASVSEEVSSEKKSPKPPGCN